MLELSEFEVSATLATLTLEIFYYGQDSGLVKAQSPTRRAVALSSTFAIELRKYKVPHVCALKSVLRKIPKFWTHFLPIVSRLYTILVPLSCGVHCTAVVMVLN